MAIDTYSHPQKSAICLSTSLSSPNSVSSSSTRTPFMSYHPLSASLVSDQSRLFDDDQKLPKSPRCSELIDPISPTPYLDTGYCYSQSINTGTFLDSPQVENTYSLSDLTHWTPEGGSPCLYDTTETVPIFQSYE